jgi:hypothetical protein
MLCKLCIHDESACCSLEFVSRQAPLEQFLVLGGLCLTVVTHELSQLGHGDILTTSKLRQSSLTISPVASCRDDCTAGFNVI